MSIVDLVEKILPMGITILSCKNNIPFTICSSNLYGKYSLTSLGNSLPLSGQPYWITLGSITMVGSFMVILLISLQLTFGWSIPRSVIWRLRLGSSSPLVMSISCDIQSATETHLWVMYLMSIWYWLSLSRRCCNCGEVSFRHFWKRLTRGEWSVWTVNWHPNM